MVARGFGHGDCVLCKSYCVLNTTLAALSAPSLWPAVSQSLHVSCHCRCFFFCGGYGYLLFINRALVKNPKKRFFHDAESSLEDTRHMTYLTVENSEVYDVSNTRIKIVSLSLSAARSKYACRISPALFSLGPVRQDTPLTWRKEIRDHGEKVLWIIFDLRNHFPEGRELSLGHFWWIVNKTEFTLQ